MRGLFLACGSGRMLSVLGPRRKKHDRTAHDTGETETRQAIQGSEGDRRRQLSSLVSRLRNMVTLWRPAGFSVR